MDKFASLNRRRASLLIRFVTCIATLPFLLASQTVQGASGPTVADVRSAWHERHERIRSFEYECEITETKFNIKRYHPFDPFGGSQDGNPSTGETVMQRIDLGKTMMLRRAGNKYAFRLSGEQWDHQTEARTYSTYAAAFDGSHNSTLFEDRLSVAILTKATTPETLHVMQAAIYLWYSPVELLERLVFQPDRMTIGNPQAEVDGCNCIELAIPRSNGRWKGLIYVDPARNFVPVRFTMTLGGVVNSERTIRYARDDVAGWVVASWIDKRFTEMGNAESIASSTVTHVAINQPIAMDDFKIELPVGTHVTEKDGENAKYFVVLDGGERRPIDENAVHEWKNPDERFLALEPRIRAIGTASPAEREATLEDLRRYVRGPDASRPNVWQLVESTARQLQASAGPDAAVRFCHAFTGESDICRQCLTRLAATIEGQQRRATLVGRQIELTGNTIDGSPFDWTPLAGKIVLVDFWFTGCGPCRKDLPWLKQLYETHRDNGFAVVGVSVDTDASALTTLLEQEKTPWPIIHEPEPTPDTNTIRYDVHSFPTYILVDQTGKVIFAGSRNDELQSLLDDKLKP